MHCKICWSASSCTRKHNNFNLCRDKQIWIKNSFKSGYLYVKRSKNQKVMSVKYFKNWRKCPSPNMLYITQNKNTIINPFKPKLHSKTIHKTYALDLFASVVVVFVSKWMTHFMTIFHPMTREYFTKPSEGQLGCSVVLWCTHLHMQDRNNASIWAVCRLATIPIRSQPEVEMTNTIRQRIHHPVSSDSNCPGSMSQSPC